MRQAFNYVLQQYSGSQALVQEGEDVLGLDIPQTTTRDASSWCLLLLIVLRNVERLTLMLRPDPFQHQEEPILEWGDHVQVLRHLELRSLSIFCTGQYTGSDIMTRFNFSTSIQSDIWRLARMSWR
ncbi:hypothetical protein N0V87_007602 [Didymella glomerata]|uniref:Uncharacterized protein n=1 Tax=Didymella glomerata TaxID=749621 RepID=A0A9W8WVR2_9PLEO|nr:hypothetical protein N0V87_007602 [Didymella glomerata]